MNLDEAIKLVRNAVKYTGTIDQKHIDLTIVPAAERERYQQALAVMQTAVKAGTLSKDDLAHRLHLDY